MTPTKPPRTLAQMADEAAQADNGKGIPCPGCGYRHWWTQTTRPMQGIILRYRICRRCGHRKKTIER